MKISKIIDYFKEYGPILFFKKLANMVVSKIMLPCFMINAKLFKSSDINELIDFVYGSPIEPMQIPEEIFELLEIIKEKKPKTVLEIGTARGGNLFLFSRIITGDSKIISIDLPGGLFGGGYSKLRMLMYKFFAKDNQSLRLVRKDSHQEGTLEDLKNILGNEKIDFLFIDGDHSYNGVKKDFEMYSPLVSKDGIIGFHDIVEGLEENVGGFLLFGKKLKIIINIKKLLKAGIREVME